ncbi:unnamed protein product, partial [Rotaria sp. Silwood1]
MCSFTYFSVKPGPAFWNEMKAFMMTHSDEYKCDGRTIEQIGAELGLNAYLIQRVQQDAFKSDKIAMNVWRAIRPTAEARLEVGSIKNVPKSTIENIYSFARLCLPKCGLSVKKVRSDIAANLRLAQFNSKVDENNVLAESQATNEIDYDD